MALTVDPPLVGTIRPLHGWTIGAVKSATAVPLLGAIRPLDRGTIVAVSLTMNPPLPISVVILDRGTIVTVMATVRIPLVSSSHPSTLPRSEGSRQQDMRAFGTGSQSLEP